VTREFSLDEARQALAEVRAPLAALQDVQRRLRDVQAELRGLKRRHLNNGVVAEAQMRALMLEQAALAEQARQHVSAIGAAGAELKSIEGGLLDFPTQIAGVPAYWCWRAGEDEIEWWHPRDTGFAGRRRIEPEP
jgi:hypothetical protein